MPYQSALITIDKRPFSLMGIVNVTPDSFYDGGRYNSVDGAIAHARELKNQGVDILDIGGASSRPGAEAVSPEEELQRVLPVIETVADFFNGPVSIDTTWSSVARKALEAGAVWVNDISAGRCDAGMAPLVARCKCKVLLMHSRGTPQTMQLDPRYDDVVSEVTRELLDAVGAFKKCGVKEEQILLDPGIGFAKTFAHNIELIRGMDRIVALGYPVVIGTSRKAFIGKITGREAKDRLYGTLGSVAAAYLKGVTVFRVHDVAATGDFLKVFTDLEKPNRAGMCEA